MPYHIATVTTHLEVVYTPKNSRVNYMGKKIELLSLVFFKIRGEPPYTFSLIMTVIKYLVSAPLDSISPIIHCT